jgi:hypothetical protein
VQARTAIVDGLRASRAAALAAGASISESGSSTAAKALDETYVALFGIFAVTFATGRSDGVVKEARGHCTIGLNAPGFRLPASGAMGRSA